MGKKWKGRGNGESGRWRGGGGISWSGGAWESTHGGVASYPEEEDEGLGGQVGCEQGGGPQVDLKGQLGRMARWTTFGGLGQKQELNRKRIF
jgi:hypothetical protein